MLGIILYSIRQQHNCLLSTQLLLMLVLINHINKTPKFQSVMVIFRSSIIIKNINIKIAFKYVLIDLHLKLTIYTVHTACHFVTTYTI